MSTSRGFVKKMKVGDEDGGHSASFLQIVWAWIVVHAIAFKFNIIELLTKHRKINMEAVGKRTGGIAVVTGGARGIGVEVVQKLLECDMHVIVGCRNVSAGNQVINQIREKGIKTGKTDVLPLDLMSLDSVKEFAQQVNAKTDRINLLINNAGIMFVPYTETVDGFESSFQVNYLSHFLLARLFHQSLIKGGRQGNRQSRIVNVSSCASLGGDVDFSDLQLKRNFCKYNSYMTTKLLQVIFSNAADRKYREEGVPIRSYSLHPGIVKTDLYAAVWWVQLIRFITPYLFKTPEQGADTVCYAALSPDIENEGGLFLANSQKLSPNPKATDPKLQDQLWDITCDLIDSKLNH